MDSSRHDDGRRDIAGWGTALLKAMPDGVVVTSQDGSIVFVNELACRTTGFSSEELIGRRVDILLPAWILDGLDGHRGRDASSADPRTTMSATDVQVRRKEGSSFPADLGISPIDDGQEPLIAFVIRDTSEQSDLGAAHRARRSALVHADGQGRIELDAIIHSLFLASASLHILADESDPQTRGAALSIAFGIDEAIRDLRAYVRTMDRPAL